ncbi:hypothetical protein PG999_012568 [Apiospora kogelbergensis]|uniref:TLC domain-containing protein n=1 Tax=Apiospora kogelbergensis TaxID=1337665 RepID=A0AAW0QH74_9PEZI
MASREFLSELLPTTPLILGVIGYSLVSFWVEDCIRRRVPSLYEQFKTNHRKLCYISAYFVGKFLAVVFVPACTIATIQGNGTASATLVDTPWHATTVEKVCVVSRVVIWIGEFPRTQVSTALVAHHAWSVVSMLIILGAGHPPAQLYVMYAALLTETFSKLSTKSRLIEGLITKSPLQKMADSGRLGRMADWANLVGILGLRLPSIIYALHMVQQIPYRTAPVWMNMVGMGYYLVYALYLSYRSAVLMGLIKVSAAGLPKHFILFDRLTFSWNSCLVGLARVATYVSSVVLYSVGPKQETQQRDSDLERIVAITAVAAILLGRTKITSKIRPLKIQQPYSNASSKAPIAKSAYLAEDVIRRYSSDATLIDSSASEDEKDMIVVGRAATKAQPSGTSSGRAYTSKGPSLGSWLHWAFDLSVTVLVLSSWGLPIKFNSRLAAAVILTLPLAEVIAPLGCHSVPGASVSPGKVRTRPGRSKTTTATRGVHFGFSVAVYAALVTLTVYGMIELLQAALISITLHSAVQVWLDYQGIQKMYTIEGAPLEPSWLQVLAATRSSSAQCCLALACLNTMEGVTNYWSTWLKTNPNGMFRIIMFLLLLVAIWSTSLRKRASRLLEDVASWAVRPMVYSSCVALYILGHMLHILSQEIMPLEDRKALGRNAFEQVLDSILQWKVVVALMGVFLLPILGSIRPMDTAAAKTKAEAGSLPQISVKAQEQLCRYEDQQGRETAVS